MCVCHSAVSNSLPPHGLQPVKLLCPWNSPGRNTGVGIYSLLQGIFLTQILNLGLLHCRQIFLPSGPPGKPISLSNFQFIPLYIYMWTYGILFYSVGYNLLLSLFIFILYSSLIGQWAPSHVIFCILLTHPSLSLSLFSGIRCSRLLWTDLCPPRIHMLKF